MQRRRRSTFQRCVYTSCSNFFNFSVGKFLLKTQCIFACFYLGLNIWTLNLPGLLECRHIRSSKRMTKREVATQLSKGFHHFTFLPMFSVYLPLQKIIINIIYVFLVKPKNLANLATHFLSTDLYDSNYCFSKGKSKKNIMFSLGIHL